MEFGGGHYGKKGSVCENHIHMSSQNVKLGHFWLFYFSSVHVESVSQEKKMVHVHIFLLSWYLMLQ